MNKYLRKTTDQMMQNPQADSNEKNRTGNLGKRSQRVDSLKRSLEIIYGSKTQSLLLDIPVDRLFPTEDFLENDKLALVFKKTVNEGYDVPIIAVENGTDYFVLDGHHRSFIYVKLRKKTIKARVMKFPQEIGLS